ncbi:cysteine/serine-rich nuclear protein, partial [Pimephales promelas]
LFRAERRLRIHRERTERAVASRCRRKWTYEILSFSDADNEDCSVRERNHNCATQQKKKRAMGYGIFSAADDKLSTRERKSRYRSISQWLCSSHALAIHRSLRHYMDLSLSSESDLEFFDGFPCLGPSSLYNSLKEYEHMDNFFQFQLPTCPSLPQAADPGTCLLESLIGLSDSVPEPPATFTDNQMLEDAMKLSVMESVKV